MSKFIVIDGNSLTHRAFWALPNLTNKAGTPTGAVMGFTNMLLKLLDDERPDYLAVAWDKGRPTFRIEAFTEYKAHRKPTPSELKSQMPILKDLLSKLGIACYELEGYEADDLIGTLVRKAEAQGFQSVIVTGDKDSLQLISPQTKVLLTKRGISDLALMDLRSLQEETGLKPEQIIDLKALQGDSSDNIPGVPGIGPKTAQTLLLQYGNLEVIYENLDQIKAKGTREKLSTNRELAFISYGLATIDTNVPLDADWEAIKQGPLLWQQALPLLQELEFKNILKRVEASVEAINDAPEMESVTTEIFKITDAQVAEDLLKQCKAAKLIGLSYEGSSRKLHEAKLMQVALCLEENGPVYQLEVEDAKRILADPDIQKAVHDAKGLYWLCHNTGLELEGVVFDTMVAEYLLDPNRNNQLLAKVAEQHLQISIEEQLADQALVMRRLYSVMQAALQEADLCQLYAAVEHPLIKVLARMELQGVTVDKEFLQEMSHELLQALDKLTEEIYSIAGESFNINSPKQLGVILFERLGLPVKKKTKTGYSTDAEVLEELADEHEIVAKILEYRQLAKLKATYADGLSNLVGADGKIHTTFNQTITATGRLSSTEPNLQNIPIRLELGRKIRKAFKPSREKMVMLAADYSQIELRILAHISQDKNLVEAFNHNQDIHTRTAAEVFGVPMDMVTEEMRSRAKAVNFGIVYGLSDFGLSRDIKVTRKEAKSYIDNYFARYAGVKTFIDSIISEARSTGLVRTLLKRQRFLSDINSHNRNLRNFAERTAMNTPIQGTAADVIKVAMVNMANKLEELKLETKMLLQVHDELIFEVPEQELETMKNLVKEQMEQAVQMTVPISVDVKLGPNWYEVKKI